MMPAKQIVVVGMSIGGGRWSDKLPTSMVEAYQTSSNCQPLEKRKDAFSLCTNSSNDGNPETTMNVPLHKTESLDKSPS